MRAPLRALTDIKVRRFATPSGSEENRRLADMTGCVACAARHDGLCARLSDRDLEVISSIAHQRTLSRGQALSHAGDVVPVCGNLVSGLLKVSATTEDGREQIVELVRPSGFVGRPYADSSEFTVSALADSKVCLFPRAAFQQTLELSPAVERSLLRSTFTLLDETRARLVTLARRSAEERVAGFLLEMLSICSSSVVRAAPGSPATFDLPLSRGEIAELLGLTIETVSRQMTRLKVAGVIKLPGARSVTISDEAALRARAGLS